MPTRLKNEKMAAAKYLIRRILEIQQSLQSGNLDNVHWLPGLEVPADGTTGVKSDVIPLLRLLEPGAFHPAFLRPLKCVSPDERAGE